MGFGAIASIAGGLIGSSSSKKAAAAQQQTAERDLAFQRETRDLIFDRMDPFYGSGITAQNALSYELGLGNRPMIGGTAPQIETFTEPMSTGQAPGGPNGVDFFGRPDFGPGRSGEERRREWENARRIVQLGGGAQPQSVTRYRVGGNTFNSLEEAQAWANANPQGGTEYQGFTATPGYQFAFDQGVGAVNALAGARGGLNSGRTMQDLTTFGQGIANQEYGNYLNRLTGMAGQGFSAAGATANAATNAAQGTSNALAGIGNAQSAGAIGAGNAWTGAINNGLSLWQYQRGLQPSQGGGTGAFGLPRPF